MKTANAYEGPTVERLGLVAELTEAAGLHNADNPTGVDDAYSNH